MPTNHPLRTDNSANQAASTPPQDARPLQQTQADYNPLTGDLFERIKELEANEVILLREHRMLYAGYEHALFVAVDLLEDLPIVWRNWLLDNIYRHSVSAAVFADIAKYFSEVSA